MKQLAAAQYNRISVLPDVVQMEDYDASRHQGGFMQLPYRPLMDTTSFNDPTVVMDLVFGEIGRDLAFSETKLIVERLKSDVVTGPSATPIRGVVESVASLQSGGRIPSAVLAPVRFYMDWYDELAMTVGPQPFRIEKEEETTHLVFPDGLSLRLVWSNKLSPLDEFFVIDKRWARWVSKPNTHDRFEITERTAGNKVDLIFRIVFKFDVQDAMAVRRFVPQEPRRR